MFLSKKVVYVVINMYICSTSISLSILLVTVLL